MANVETEQNKTLVPQQEGGEQSASINLHEENLEALLNALSGSGTPALAPREAVPTPQAAAPVAPVLAAPVPVAAPLEKTSTEVQIQSPIVAEPEPTAQPVEEPKRMEATAPPAPAPQIAPLAAVQQDMSSKLALLSSIKQRRAITARPEMIEAPPQPAVQTEKPIAHQPSISRTSEPAKEITPTLTSRATAPQQVRGEEKPTLPAKKIWTSQSSTRATEEAKEEEAPREQKTRREEKSTQEEKHQPVQEEAPRAEVRQRRDAAPKPSDKTDLPSFMASSGLAQDLPSLETLESGEASGTTPSFFTSKAGMGAIGGGVAVAALAAYLLMGHGSKPGNAAKPGATGAAQTANATAVVPSVTDGKSTDTNSTSAAANQHPNTPSATPSSPNAGNQQTALAQQKPGTVTASTAIPQTPQQVAPPQPPVVETPKTTARKFAAPTPAARPVSATITDAPPALTPTATAPGVVALPTRFAPLPPPPPGGRAAAPQATPAQATSTSGQPSQITVPGKTQATRLARQVLPVYPALAKTARVQGTVRFRVTVGIDGAVKSLTPLGGPLPLVQAATDAVRQWRYQPTLVEGRPVEVVTEIDVAFAL